MKELTIRDLEQIKGGSIFVLNNTKGESRSQLFLTCPKINGDGSDTVTVPVTFIPIDLTEQVTRRQLLESSSFRRMVARQMVKVIDEESAVQLLKDPSAIAEQDKLRNELNAGVSLGQQDAVDSKPEILESNMPEGVAPGVVQVVELLRSGESEELAVINTIRSMGELEQEDYRYILNNSTGYEKLRDFASHALGQLAPA